MTHQRKTKATTGSTRSRIDLREIFLGLQSQMATQLGVNRRVIRHPTAKGDGAELQWLRLFEDYLPERYCAAKAFVLDSDGNLSEQLDVVIYDRQYSPFLFNQDGTRYVPAESVYAVFEVKQDITGGTLAYAGKKIASVRALRRTSARIVHAGGVYRPKKPIPILAGILALDVEWKSDWSAQLSKHLALLRQAERLDIGCALRRGSFDTSYRGRKPSVTVSDQDAALIDFFIRFLARLQAVGTVAALDFNSYGKAL